METTIAQAGRRIRLTPVCTRPAIIGCLTAVLAATFVVWLWEGLFGASLGLAQIFGGALAALLVLPVATAALRDPALLAEPIHVFLVGCVYFLVLDMATLRDVEEFPPLSILLGETAFVVFLVPALALWLLVKARRSPLTPILRWGAGTISANTLFWMAFAVFSLEVFKRFALVGWSVSQFWYLLLQSRAGGVEGDAMHFGVNGDWRVILQPIGVVFPATLFLADRAWKKGVRPLKKTVLLLISIAQLGILVLDGARSLVVMSLVLPFLARALERDPSIRRWLWGIVAGSFLLAPLFDTMVQVRASGWSNMDRVDKVAWNAAEAHRDDNFHWVVNIVDVLRSRGPLLQQDHQGPLGFIDGLAEEGGSFAISLIPRIFWPEKPMAIDNGDDLRSWNVTTSIVGDLLRMGGISFLLVGGLLFGLGVRILEPIYWTRMRGEGELLGYALLMYLLLHEVRGIMAYHVWGFVFLILMGGFRAQRWMAEHFGSKRRSRQLSVG
ncbi:hypothetical protein [Methylacidimicrobium tartarophylax]|uniref:Uncharacterized protein n=1 Tax=Methylacidimicrobium tartarophylax TaxID=1041768 RepID=A0A5E6MAQ9_9BACT|nr:hypothetical protein [Methylacidimicrobium tartarophylax]VVM06495.1 hypothetical protein MAMT_01236 [Methylacidimicrobium tartarophylax]